MTTRNTLLAMLAAALLGAGLSYYFSPEKRVETIRTVEVEKVVVQVKHVVTRVTEHPDGTKHTEIVEDTNTSERSDSVETDSKVEVTKRNSRANVSVLLGFTNYGLHAQKSILGPITAGVWATSTREFNDIRYGISLGINF